MTDEHPPLDSDSAGESAADAAADSDFESSGQSMPDGSVPLRDVVVFLVAAFVAWAILLTATDGNLVGAAAGAFVGGVWFFLGTVYGYGEAVDGGWR